MVEIQEVPCLELVGGDTATAAPMLMSASLSGHVTSIAKEAHRSGGVWNQRLVCATFRWVYSPF